MNPTYNTVDYICDDLIANQRSYDDNVVFAKLVIERLLESRSIDLISLAPYSSFSWTMNKLDSLIGFNSSTFKTICAHEDLFEHFLGAYCSMVKRTPVQEPHFFKESAYYYFLSSYLENLLPCNDQKLTSVKSSDWFVFSPNSSSIVNSPLKLLRPEVVESSFASEFAYVPTFRNLYPKLYQFINHLIRFLTILDNWPNIMQLVVLKNIMEHYYRFLMAETNDRDFMSFKMRLRTKPPFYNTLYDFLRRMLEDWPIDWTYITIVGLWKLLSCPRNLIQDDAKLRQFMSSPSNYIDLIEVIVIRVLEADVTSQAFSSFMDYLLEQVFSETSIELMDEFAVPMCDYLILIREKIQSTYEHEKSKANNIQQHAKLTLIERLLDYVRGLDLPSSPYALTRLEKYLSSTTARLNRFSITDDSILNISTSYNISLPIDQNSPISPTKIPDHIIDRRTKLMHLTSSGRAQVINRQAKFDFRKCSKVISTLYPPKTPWQNAALLKLSQTLSAKYNNSKFGRYLRYNRHDSMLAKLLAKILLRQVPAPRFLGENIPVFSKTVARNHYCLDLSLFANYFVIVTVGWLLLSLLCHSINLFV